MGTLQVAAVRPLVPVHDVVVPVRLGVANAQTSWLLERAGAPSPVLLPHVKLRVRDVMRKQFAIGRPAVDFKPRVGRAGNSSAKQVVARCNGSHEGVPASHLKRKAFWPT